MSSQSNTIGSYQATGYIDPRFRDDEIDISKQGYTIPSGGLAEQIGSLEAMFIELQAAAHDQARVQKITAMMGVIVKVLIGLSINK